MKSEIKERNLKLDDKWNDYCNATIYHAYKMERLSQQDRKIVEDYINKVGESMFELSCKKVKMYKIKDALYWGKVKVERKIKKLVY